MDDSKLPADELIWGDPALKDRIAKQQAKGNLVAARNRWITTNFGEDRVRSLAEQLDGEARRWLLEPPLALSWCAIDELVRIDRLMIADTMEGDVSKMRRFGEDIADYDLSTLYKMLLRVGTPTFIVRNLNAAYRAYLRPGTTRTEIVDSGKAHIRLQDAVLPYYYCEYGIPGWINVALEKSGGKNVSISQSSCIHRGDETCLWSLSWS